MERTPFRQRRIQTKGHRRCRRGFCAFHGQFGYHTFSRRQLTAAAEGHQNRIAANSRVKTLGKPLLTANIQILQIGQPALLQVLFLGLYRCRNLPQIAAVFVRTGNLGLDMLTNTIGIQEFALHLYNGLAPPVHNEARFLRDFSHLGRFQIFCISKLGEFLQLFRTDYHGHAFL